MLSHTLQFALMLAIFSNLVQHTWWVCATKRRDPSHFSKYGPAYMVSLASLFIMAAPSYLVLKDSKHVPPMGDVTSNMLRVSTLLGYTFVIVGTLWAFDVWAKIQRAWVGRSGAGN